MTEHGSGSTRTIVVVHAGTSDPSSTRMLADRIASRTAATGAERGLEIEVRSIDLRTLASDIMVATTSGLLSPELEQAGELLHAADGIVASTPVYKAGASGLFTGFFQVLDNDLLIGTPVVLAATAGSARHALVVDDQLRGLFAYLRTLTAPTSVFAAPEDWQSGELGKRIDRAAAELALLVESDFVGKLRGDSWGDYQHSFGSAGGAELGIDLDSDLMRLATGG